MDQSRHVATSQTMYNKEPMVIASGDIEIGHVSATDLLGHVASEAADTCAVHDDLARRLQDGTEGRWFVWFGHRTCRYWAMPVQPGLNRLFEAGTLEDLRAVMGEVDAFFGSRS